MRVVDYPSFVELLYLVSNGCVIRPLRMLLPRDHYLEISTVD